MSTFYCWGQQDLAKCGGTIKNIRVQAEAICQWPEGIAFEQERQKYEMRSFRSTLILRLCLLQ